MVNSYIRTYRIPAIVTNCSNNYGPYQFPEKLIPLCLVNILKGKSLPIYGDGKQKRDFIHVNDVVRANYKCMISNINGEIFNVGSGNPQTINYLIELIGGGEKVYLPKRPGEPNITFADISKIKKLLNWEPKISFEEGVNEMLNNISFWEKAPLWDKKSIKSATKEWHQYLS